MRVAGSEATGITGEVRLDAGRAAGCRASAANPRFGRLMPARSTIYPLRGRPEGATRFKTSGIWGIPVAANLPFNPCVSWLQPAIRGCDGAHPSFSRIRRLSEFRPLTPADPEYAAFRVACQPRS